jgi:hypothetical protein
MRLLFALAALFLWVPFAGAETCGWNPDHTFWSCGSGYGGGSAGGSSPSINNAVESNPADLPVGPTPFGLEGDFYNRSSPAGKPKFSFSTVKGFEGIGFGIGSWTEGTFGAPDLATHFLSSAVWQPYQQYEANPPSVTGIRLGTGVRLLPKLLPTGIRLAVGGSLGLGRVSGDVSPQAGAIVSLLGLGLGYSQSFERISRSLPAITVSTYSVGLNISFLYLGYYYIVLHSIVNETYANVAAIRLTSSRWTLFSNAKFQKDHRGTPNTWTYSGVLRKFGNRIGIGYEYGFYRYSHTAILQIYL